MIMSVSVHEKIASWQKEAIYIRRSIHEAPELGFEEFSTKEKVISLLESFGVDEIDTSFAKTAVIATIQGKIPGKIIGLRADMDALAIHEENTFPHRSQHDGKMHACGHDGHTTMLLMAAKYLALHRDFAGTAILIFQPAEEGRGGAETLVLKEGFLAKYPLDAIYAMHNWPTLPAGHFAIKAGSLMASSDRLFISIRGKSGHAGLPHLTRDPMLVATHIYQGIQGLVARTISPLSPIVVAVTQMHCGETTNAIAETAEMAGTIRTHDEAVRKDIIEKLTVLTENMGNAFGMDAKFRLGPISHPVTVNSKAETERAIAVATALVGSQKVDLTVTEEMTSEDFAFYLKKVPGCYLFIGNGSKEDHSPEGLCHATGLHNSTYDFNDEIIPIGASFFVEVMRSYDDIDLKSQ